MLSATLSALRRGTPTCTACASAPFRARVPQLLHRRFIGEDSGLSAIADRQVGRYRPSPGYGHDPLADVSRELNETQIDSYSSKGFSVNGVQMGGTILCFPNLALLFEVPDLASLTPDSLEVFRLLKERFDTVLVGTGHRVERVPRETREWFDQQGINVETMSTRHASSTFNFMVQEKRSVAAILFPPPKPGG